AGQVIDVLRVVRVDGIRVEQHQVGGHSLRDPAALGDAEEPGRLQGETAYRLFQSQRLSLAHPTAQQVGGVRGVTKQVRMGAAVGEADEEAGVGDESLNPLGLIVERLDVEEQF